GHYGAQRVIGGEDNYLEGVFFADIHTNDGYLRDLETGRVNLGLPVEESSGRLFALNRDPPRWVQATPLGNLTFSISAGSSSAQTVAPASSVWTWLKWTPLVPSPVLTIHDMSGGRPPVRVNDAYPWCISRDGQIFASFGEEGRTVHLWDLPPRRPWLTIFGLALIPATVPGLVGAWCTGRLRLRRPHGARAPAEAGPVRK